NSRENHGIEGASLRIDFRRCGRAKWTHDFVSKCHRRVFGRLTARAVENNSAHMSFKHRCDHNVRATELGSRMQIDWCGKLLVDCSGVIDRKITVRPGLWTEHG